MVVNETCFMKEILGGGGEFNCAATCVQVQIYFCPLCYAIPVRLQENSYRQIQSHINKQVFLEKSLRSSGLILSLTKKCGCAQNRNQWQCKSNCRNGSESDIQGIRIPVPQKSKNSAGTCMDSIQEEDREGSGGQHYRSKLK
jgi:hypothetical protein